MTRAVLPNPSAREQWLFTSIIDTALHHRSHVPLLTVVFGDHDHADSETDAQDDDDIASPASPP